jgi:hypothetical protein
VAPGGGRLQTPDGKPFFAVIVNYVGHRDRAWQQFQAGKFDPALIEADYRLARDAGANTIRTFVAAPLQNEFTQGDWTKLDAVVAAAERAGVFLLLTLADYGPAYLQTMATHAGLIAARYRGNPTILGYDLRNEPRLYNLVVLHYGQPIPLLSPDLAANYPPKQSQAEALAWARGAGKIPGWLPDADAINYANAFALFTSFHEAATAWAGKHNLTQTVAEFMRSADARAWQPFLAALDATVAAWLAPQIAAIRAADPDRLITVGWNDPVLASLPANGRLDFMSLHRYPLNASRWLTYNVRVAAALRAAFGGKPALLTEFGYPNHDMPAEQAAICESAGWLQAFDLGLAGAGKWMLWDLPPGPNPKERSFGLYTAAGEPKPSAWALPALSELLAPSAAPSGKLTLAATGGIAYRFESDRARFASGDGAAGDDVVRWQGAGLGQLFAYWPAPELVRIRATAAGRVTLDLGRLRHGADPREYTLTHDAAPLPHARDGALLTFDIRPGQTVECRYATDQSVAGVDAVLAILWPHGNAPVTEATLGNLTAYLLQPGTRWAVACDFAGEVTLWQAQNNEPARPAAIGTRRLAEFGGRRVPVWDFNDIDISAARDGATKLYFSARVAGVACRSNLWAHGSDARTYLPQPFQAELELPITAETAPAEVDARIQILWPHGGAAISQAGLANISVDLFLPGTRLRLAPATFGAAWQPAVWLVRAVDNGVGERVARGAPRIEPSGAAHWDFNDVDVSPARNPASKVHFWIEVEGVRAYSNFWTHGLDARTYLPNPEPPLGNCL